VTLAEIPFPNVDPVAFHVPTPWGSFPVRWYGLSYVLAFLLAFLVLRMLARRGRWPVPPARVGDVLFWGILGVFLGGRIGYMLFYAEDKSWSQWARVWEGGMAFHGGILGVVGAYFVWAIVQKIPFRWIGDGLALATPLGIFCVRVANFINGELPGRKTDVPWSFRFPNYDLTTGALKDWTDPRHPSQLYEGLTEGLLTFFILRWLMLVKRWGGGTIGAMFLILYGGFRFVCEFWREPDKQIGYELLGMTRGQEFCVGMVALGVFFLVWMRRTWKPYPLGEGLVVPPEATLFPPSPAALAMHAARSGPTA
jgi:phosphatidylglycerol:prolipoprotein diacylglycerol transferase